MRRIKSPDANTHGCNPDNLFYTKFPSSRTELTTDVVGRPIIQFKEFSFLPSEDDLRVLASGGHLVVMTRKLDFDGPTLYVSPSLDHLVDGTPEMAAAVRDARGRAFREQHTHFEHVDNTGDQP